MAITIFYGNRFSSQVVLTRYNIDRNFVAYSFATSYGSLVQEKEENSLFSLFPFLMCQGDPQPRPDNHPHQNPLSVLCTAASLPSAFSAGFRLTRIHLLPPSPPASLPTSRNHLSSAKMRKCKRQTDAELRLVKRLNATSGSCWVSSVFRLQ